MRPYDPRDIITPDAFSVAPALLGIRLAHPWRRLLAFGIDGIFASIIARTSPVVLVALVAALLLWRAVGGGSAASLTRRTTRLALRALIALFAFIMILELWDLVTPDRAEPEPEPPAAASPATEAVAGEIGGEVPADSAAAEHVRLRGEVEQLRRRTRELEQRVAEAEEESRPVRAFFSEVSDELGLGLGWFGLYFTALTVLGRGQTPGKRILGIRVIRLDGAPIGWWVAIERFGGYAASFFSGLLGFAQVLWDRNRQALHDKATHTVVIRVIGGEPVRSPAAPAARPR